jgi:hypothetical protein
MTGYAGIDALIGFAVAVLVIGLIVIAGLAKAARPKSKGLELEAAYRRFSTSADPAAVDAERLTRRPPRARTPPQELAE